MTDKANKPLGVVQVLKMFFGDIRMAELKDLPSKDRRELAELAAEDLGVTLKAA